MASNDPNSQSEPLTPSPSLERGTEPVAPHSTSVEGSTQAAASAATPHEDAEPAPPAQATTGDADGPSTDSAASSSGNQATSAAPADAPGASSNADSSEGAGAQPASVDGAGAATDADAQPAAAATELAGSPTAAEPDVAEPSATPEAAPPEGQPEASASASASGSEAPSTAEALSPSEAPGDKKKKRRRRRKKKGAGHDSERPERESRAPRPPERTPFHVGEEVFGKVTAVLETAVMVDLSGKALAIFDRGEMEPDDLVPAVGDRFLARVHNDGGRGGLVVLTRKPLREEESKPVVEAAAKSGELIWGMVTGAIKGGVEVDISGLRAFAPASGMDLHPANANFTGLVGQRLQFKVVQYEKQGRDVVVTRRPMLESEAHERRKKALALLQEGAEMQGVVRTVVEWGAFVALPDAENLEGLVHASEVSHDPRVKVADAVKPGDKFPVKITKIDEKGKIWLSRKALMQDPWAEAKKKFASGSRHQGKVVRLEKFGAFIELDSEIDGLIHVSDLAFQRVEHPSDVLSVGQQVDVVVRHFDLKNRKINLHPALTDQQADEPEQKVTRNAKVQAEVIKGDTAGVQVRVLGVTGRTARGFIPAGQTGTQRGTDLRKVFKPGQKLDLKVIDLDPKRGEPKLSLRALKEDEERKAHREYRQKVKEEAKFGTLGDLLKAKLNIASGNESSD